MFGLEFFKDLCVRLGDGVWSSQEAKGASYVSVGAFRGDGSGEGVNVDFRAVGLRRVWACGVGSSRGRVVDRVA